MAGTTPSQPRCTAVATLSTLPGPRPTHTADALFTPRRSTNAHRSPRSPVAVHATAGSSEVSATWQAVPRCGRRAASSARSTTWRTYARTHAMQRTRARVRARTTPAAPATDVYRAPRHPVTAARLAVAMECPGVAPSRGRRTFRVRVRPSPPEAHPPAALGRARHPASLAAPRALAPPRHGPRQGEPPARRASDRQRRQQSVRVQRVQTLESLLSLTGRVRVASPTRARGARATSVAAPATSRGRAGEEATVYYYYSCSLWRGDEAASCE